MGFEFRFSPIAIANIKPGKPKIIADVLIISEINDGEYKKFAKMWYNIGIISQEEQTVATKEINTLLGWFFNNTPAIDKTMQTISAAITATIGEDPALIKK